MVFTLSPNDKTDRDIKSSNFFILWPFFDSFNGQLSEGRLNKICSCQRVKTQI